MSKDYTEKRLEEYCKKFGLCKENGTCQCKKELKFLTESIHQARADERKAVLDALPKKKSFIDIPDLGRGFSQELCQGYGAGLASGYENARIEIQSTIKLMGEK